MAITLDPATKVFSVPQADLTLITGTLYEMDTETHFRAGVNALMASEPYIWMPPSILHNTEVTVAGTTFFRTIEVINGYSVVFTPDAQWSVRLVGSNNNVFDVENGILVQNQVQVIPNNSGGGIVVETGTSGLTPTESSQLTTAANTLPGIESDIATMQTDISAIQGNVATIQTDIGTINGNVTSIQGDVATIQTDIGTVQVDLALMTKISRNKKITEPTTGMLRIYEDNGIDVAFECQLYETMGVGQTYRGKGIQRQERLEAPP